MNQSPNNNEKNRRGAKNAKKGKRFFTTEVTEHTENTLWTKQEAFFHLSHSVPFGFLLSDSDFRF